MADFTLKKQVQHAMWSRGGETAGRNHHSSINGAAQM